MADHDEMIAVTLKVSRGMPNAELEEMAAGVAKQLPRLVRDAERAGGNVSLVLVRPVPGAPVEAPDPETRARIRDAVRRLR